MTTTVFGLILLLTLSILVGWLFSRSKNVEAPVKFMLFVLYFWVSAFIQLIIFAVLYQFGLLGFLI